MWNPGKLEKALVFSCVPDFHIKSIGLGLLLECGINCHPYANTPRSQKSCMKPWKKMTLEACFQRVGLLVLIAGLFAAALVYLNTVPQDQTDPASYAFEGGKVIPMPRDSKRSALEMERMGGKANILAAEITEWFQGLWRGRTLAYTLALLSTGSCLACFFVGNFLGHAPSADATDRKGLSE
jgi:hypothetical protein